ncbi:MAG: CDP-alcohol phosphatidyltransferase family protein [Proteobacteria bacterium]|nr:CDP-alcohol phosphatidyltransferase family protein [Pseudomonadota bacterium]
MPPPGRPWVTANQVTLARLIPMPLLSWLIYQGGKTGFAHNPYMWSALIAGTLIACTDWVDGMLARKWGPTVLGGLLDPIADKVFVAFAYLPFADPQLITGGGSLVPAWACGAMFVREFFVTALRSAYEQRDLTLKTSYLAKVKTWTQMQGIGMMLLFPLVANDAFVFWLLLIGAIIPIVLMVTLWFTRKKLWRGAFVMTGGFLAILGLQLYNTRYTIPGIMIAIVVLTWASAFDYVAVGWKQLRGRGDFSRADFVRLVGSISIPTLVFTLLARTDTPRWTLFLIMALELAAGGLDNLLSHHKAATKALAWGGRVLGVSVMLGGALLAPDRADLFAIIAAAGSLGGVAAEFWRGRNYFLDKRIRDKQNRAAAAAAVTASSDTH